MAYRARGRRGGRGRGFVVNNGEENEFGNQNHEMEELRQQVATLTAMVQNLQVSRTGSGGSENSHSHFDNPFGDPNWRRPPSTHSPYSWERDIKIELPEFNGSLKPNEFVDWIHTVERVFDYGEVSEEKKVKLVAIHLKGRASAWWEQLQGTELRRGKGKIREWEKMKMKLNEQFLLFNYMQNLYKNLHNLKQVGSVDEYTDAFHQLLARVDLNESEDQMVARYISGLTTTIQDALTMQTLWTVSEAYTRALVAEKQEKMKFSRFGQQYQGGSKSGQPFHWPRCSFRGWYSKPSR